MNSFMYFGNNYLLDEQPSMVSQQYFRLIKALLLI